MFKDIWIIIKSVFLRLFQSRLTAVALLMAVLFGILINRLVDLQVVNGEKYSEDYIESIERVVRTPGARGNIYDADGNLLAYNKLSYNVTISDNGSYASDYNARNLMLYRLSAILDRHNVDITSRFEVAVDADGNYYYTSPTEASRKRFIAGVYGKDVSMLDTEERYSSQISAYDIFRKKAADYAFNEIKDEKGHPMVLEEHLVLDMVKILYTMRQTAFKRYETTTIAKGIDDECVAELLENQSELKGVSVQESYIRRYNNAKYFSHIIGYTGSVQDEAQLTELQKTDASYELTDVVGATGLEKTMELALKGIKGEKEMYVDSHGQILEVISETEPAAGDNLYLSIRQNLQIGVYHLLEQQLAGILANKIINLHAADIEEAEKASEIMISVDDAYYQLINNNVLDMDHFTAEDAGMAEQDIGQAFEERKRLVMRTLRKELSDENASTMSELTNEYIAYMVYIYDYLASSEVGVIDRNSIDQYGDSYTAWKNDTISLRTYLRKGISEGWVDSAKVASGAPAMYEDSGYIFERLSSFILDRLQDDRQFNKLIYKYMIIDRTEVTGRLLCLALFEQGIIPMKADQYNALFIGDEDIAYRFLIDRILDIDITPAQLALDPCMGSVVVTDVNTGEIKALVTYPGYDNNMINDRGYFNDCLHDQSLPLINSATQTNKAPGSTFKPISAAAVIEEKALSVTDVVNCTGKYTEVSPPIRCWLFSYPGHGNLTVTQAIENSCNFCFASYGHILSTEKDPETGEEVYSTNTGLEKIRKYAALFGLDRKSGIQIEEKEPKISDSDPERSAFGQGTHSFNNVQLARYTAAVANNGKLFNLTLLQKETDPEGRIKQTFPAEQIDTVKLSQETWDVMHNGLRAVITTGVAKAVFEGYKTVKLAGKTGTAEEVSTRGNHSFFMSYAPYDDPEIAVNVTIPFGYSSGNAAQLARKVYDYYYGAIDLPAIVTGSARGIGNINIIGD